jgi:hypothetical protein
MNDAHALKILTTMKQRIINAEPNLVAFPLLQSELRLQTRALSCAIRRLAEPRREVRKKKISYLARA